MKAVILSGGLGTRVKPLTNILPKPMVPIIERPLISHILELLKSMIF
ncbi:MAG: sugar phosphate nucleotidyltransferase [Sulfurovum sp.]|nr:sugar phosphate nucleotidyltransferase [Sulfurovum sp.]